MSNNRENFRTHLMNKLFNSLSIRATAAAITLVSAPSAMAQIFGEIPEIGGTDGDIRGTVLSVLNTVLSFMALVAVVFIVIAGIRLVVSQGEDAEKDKAKKTIIYVIVGLIIILLAQAIVTFIAEEIATS